MPQIPDGFPEDVTSEFDIGRHEPYVAPILYGAARDTNCRGGHEFQADLET